MRPIVWTIAGSDSGGGAGIQADLKTFFDFNVHGCSVITGLTAQNSLYVSDIHYASKENISAQIAALKEDLPAKAVKTGMLGSADTLPLISHFLQTFPGFVVCDPVRNASSGKIFVQERDLFFKYILPHADLITPNIAEAEWLSDIKITDYATMMEAAKIILKRGAKSVLLKGGHSNDHEFCQDYWTDGKEAFWLSTPKIVTTHTHGSGCTLSAAITACIALNYELKDALVLAKMYVQQAIRLAENLGQGPGPVKQAGWPSDFNDLPYVTLQPITAKPLACAPCENIGLYPIVDSSAWVARVAHAGVSTVQLRIKNFNNTLEAEIIDAIRIAKSLNCHLFINDYWQLAIKHGAYGVHLGQEDLMEADISAIQKSGLRLGISTHSYYEIAKAHAYNPSYIACGPIYTTFSKDINFAAQGVDQLKQWRKLLRYPLVAIGGINQDNLKAVAQCAVNGVAMISTITRATDPETVIKKLNRVLHSVI